MVKVLRSFVRRTLEPHIVGFAGHLLRQGYARTSTGQHVCFLAHLDRWMSVEGIGLDGLSRPVIERYLDQRRAAGYVEYCSMKALPPRIPPKRRSAGRSRNSCSIESWKWWPGFDSWYVVVAR